MNEAAERLCPACHHKDHDPGSCDDCPRCELHYDEAFSWAVEGQPDLLAAERKATLVDIWKAMHAFDSRAMGTGVCSIGSLMEGCGHKINWVEIHSDLLAPILDAEAAR